MELVSKIISHFKNNIYLGYVCIDKKDEIISQTRNLFSELNFNKLELAIPI